MDDSGEGGGMGVCAAKRDVKEEERATGEKQREGPEQVEKQSVIWKGKEKKGTAGGGKRKA